MVAQLCDRRRTELLALKKSSPAQLISAYRHYAGLDECQELPRNVSYFAMIELILDGEAHKRRIAEELLVGGSVKS